MQAGLLPRHLSDAVLCARDARGAWPDAAQRVGGAAVPRQEHHEPGRWYAREEGLRRATALQATVRGRRLCTRITSDLIDQHKQLLQDLDPEVRNGW